MALDFPSSPTDGQIYGNFIYSTAKGAWKAKPNVPVKTAVSNVAPSNATQGDTWLNSDDGTLYVYYTDGDSSQWVEILAKSSVSSALYGRVGTLETEMDTVQNEKWQSYNYIINGGMDFWQRGTTTSSTGTGYLSADRWRHTHGTASTARTTERVALGGAITGVDLPYFFRSTITTVGTGTNIGFQYRLEDVNTLAGKTVTLSWYAKAESAWSALATVDQNFGTGGSTSVSVLSTTVSYTTLWARYTQTFSIPSISGKTVGTDSFLVITLRQNTASGSVFEFTGVQLEEGSIATPFRRNQPNIQAELAACQRYYWRTYGIDNTPLAFGFGVTTGITRFMVPLRVTMRVAPTSLDYSNVYAADGVTATTNPTSVTIDVAGTDTVAVNFNKAASFTQFRPYELKLTGASGYIGFSAEL